MVPKARIAGAIRQTRDGVEDLTHPGPSLTTWRLPRGLPGPFTAIPWPVPENEREAAVPILERGKNSRGGT